MRARCETCKPCTFSCTKGMRALAGKHTHSSAETGAIEQGHLSKGSMALILVCPAARLDFVILSFFPSPSYLWF